MLPAHDNPMKTGLVVEDQPLLAQWLMETLVVCFPEIVVRDAATCAAALQAIDSAVPDIALVDLGLPDGSGVEVIRNLARREADCQIVVTTIYADDHHLFPALQAGAHGYLLKDQPREQTLQSLRGIALGEPPLSACIARRLLRVFDEPADKAAPSLTARERQALSLIAKGYKIADVAIGMGISHHTAHEFIKSAYRKLKVSSRAEATIEATRLGLINPYL
jgi:DNA-binding NarL/FixJ family response regulator